MLQLLPWKLKENHSFKLKISAFLFLVFIPVITALASDQVDPSAQDYSGRKGNVLYVSKLGNNSDGKSWKRAFNSIQAALSAVPDDQGGHRIIIRPDTYVEANLSTAFKGAKGSYNLITGDTNGDFGSGGKGRIIIDSGDPEKGFKSYDWWGTIKTVSNGFGYGAEGWKHIAEGWKPDPLEKIFSSNCWDRWILRNLYATGSDAGFFWDFSDEKHEGFTVIIEDCVSIGRAFGGGICYPFVRPDEPSIFRRSYFMALDWDRDTGAVLIGGEEEEIPGSPHLILDDCTLVHPDNALAISYASSCARVRAVHCRMIVLNFTQPEMGGKSTGIICTQGHKAGGKLHVDLEDCILAGYSVFTTGEDGKAVSYTTKGHVLAYVQFKQTLPEGFERINLWPTQLFDYIAIPKP